MILVDTSVWVEHLRHGHNRLAALLGEGEVLVHPFVIGELALGNLRNRDENLFLLEHLPQATMASHEEVMDMVHSRKLAGSGIGWVDAHLLASCLLSGAGLLTMDYALTRLARKLLKDTG